MAANKSHILPKSVSAPPAAPVELAANTTNEMDVSGLTVDQSVSVSLRSAAAFRHSTNTIPIADDDESSTRSALSRSLTGDLNDIVNSMARRTRQQNSNYREGGSVASPTRTRTISPLNCSNSNNDCKQTRISRRSRNKSGSRSRSPRRLESIESAATDLTNNASGDILGDNSDANNTNKSGGGGDDEDNNDGASQNSGAGESQSTLRRVSTITSRSRLFKMLDAKNLGSFRDLNQRVVEDNKPRTYMSRLFVTFQDCLHRLDAKNISNRKLEAMSILIHECMSGDFRNYHSVQHVFEISTDLTDPLAILAAMFHDTIYHSVDITLSQQQEDSLRGCFQLSSTLNDDNSGISVSGRLDPPTPMICQAHMACDGDPNLCLVETVFGYGHGQEITGNDGLNEFLSAVVAVRNLQEHLTRVQCAKIAVCIAGTIPFRNKPAPDGGKSRMQELYDNISATNTYFKLGMSDEEMVESIQRAAILQNSDIGNFGSDDIYYFLDNTWSLLTETNITLRRSFLFTVMEFQHSLFKMNGFFHFLDPTWIFASFKGVPSAKYIQQKTDQARKNLELGQKYVGAKLLSASVLAAFAVLTGGDAPLSLFVGDLPSRHHQSQSINDSLPAADENTMAFAEEDEEGEPHLDPVVYQILSGGRRSETSFDVKQSPLGAFLYAVVGDRGLKMILENKKLYPMTADKAEDLLACLPREVVAYLAKTIASVAICRAEEIMEVVNNLWVK